MSGLYLGPVAFQDFELPGRIAFGGRQLVAVHQLPGGARVIDALGRDDAPLSWTGTFSGPSAAARALQLDLMRAEGLSWSLAWDVLSYLVVVTEFSASYERQNWIPYRIVCNVIADQTAVLEQAVVSLVQDLLGDVTAANGLASVDLSPALSAIGQPSAVLPGTGAYASAAVALTEASGEVGVALASTGAAMLSAPDFPTAAANAGQAARLAAAQGYLGRAQQNLANAGS